MSKNDDSTYTVGYKKPPRRTQFKPGQSGNISGRAKKIERPKKSSRRSFAHRSQRLMPEVNVEKSVCGRRW